MITYLEDYSFYLIKVYGLYSAVESQDFIQFRNRAAELQLELRIARRKLGTDHFERQVYVFVLSFLHLTGVKYNIVLRLRLMSRVNSKVWVCSAVHLLCVQRLFMSLTAVCVALYMLSKLGSLYSQWNKADKLPYGIACFRMGWIAFLKVLICLHLFLVMPLLMYSDSLAD